MEDKILQILASSLIFVVLLFIIIKLYYYSSHIFPGETYPITLELATAISYSVSIPGDIEIDLPAYIIYESKGDPRSTLATELKINNGKYRNNIVYGVCYYRDLKDDVKRALIDSTINAINGILMGSTLGWLARLAGVGSTIALSGGVEWSLEIVGQIAINYCSNWLYKEADFEKIYLLSQKYFVDSVTEDIKREIKKKKSRSTAEIIANYAIICATAAAVLFDGLGLIALAITTIIARIAIPLVYWATGPDLLKNCWYGNPKNWGFIKINEDMYFWNPEFSLKVEIAKKENGTMILSNVSEREEESQSMGGSEEVVRWFFINPSPVIKDMNNHTYITIKMIKLKKEEKSKELRITAFIESK
ncbi:MAG TPA: hypothetical protein EYH22_03580 [Candidatus Nanopusillus sp.]|nr:hypothetical protein [Candidatus Nanopusillus sp.]